MGREASPLWRNVASRLEEALYRVVANAAYRRGDGTKPPCQITAIPSGEIIATPNRESIRWNAVYDYSVLAYASQIQTTSEAIVPPVGVVSSVNMVGRGASCHDFVA